METRTKRWLYPTAIALLVAGMGVAAYYLMPWMVRIATDPAERDLFLQGLRDQGPVGALILGGLVFLQVIVPVLPAEALEIGSGILYGTLAGGLVCLAGHTLGTVLNYHVGRYLGAATLSLFVKPEKLAKAQALVQGKKADLLVFLLYFIPGIPKDLAAYAAGLSSYPFLRFLLVSLVARLPSVFSSSFIGERLAAGHVGEAVILFAAIAVVALPAFLFSERILSSISARKKDVPHPQEGPKP